MLIEGCGILIDSFELLWLLVSGMKLAFVTLLVGLEHDKGNGLLCALCSVPWYPYNIGNIYAHTCSQETNNLEQGLCSKQSRLDVGWDVQALLFQWDKELMSYGSQTKVHIPLTCEIR